MNAEVWHKNNPDGKFSEWQVMARNCVLEGLHYDPGPLDLRAETLSREERPNFSLERVAFNTTPWFRVEGFFLLPKGVSYPVPGLVLLHAWGGPMLFGKERVVNTGRDHPVLVAHRQKRTTWMGVNFWDDSRSVDYLQLRPEVDPNRIGCTGLSGGGWRTNFLAALDDRIIASVSAG